MTGSVVLLFSIILVLTLVSAKNNIISAEEAGIKYSSIEGGYDYDNDVFYDEDTVVPDFVREQIENREDPEEYNRKRQGSRPVINIGYTYYFQGDPSPRLGVEAWVYHINTTTGLNVSGVIHNVRLIMYNDGNDCNAKYILYKYMAEFDNVTAFIAPSGTCFGAKTFYGIARQYKIPMINGANSVLAWFTPISQLPYVWTMFPPINGVTGECTAAMKLGCGLESAVYLFQNGTQATSLYSLQITSLNEYNITATEIAINATIVGPIGTKDWNDTMDAIIVSLRDDIKPDMFFWSYYGGVTLLDRIRLAKWEPPAIFTQAGVGLLNSRLAAGWRGRGLLALSAWDETTVFPDPFFGNSSVFVELYNRLNNRSLDTFAGVMAASVVVLGRAIEIAGTITDGVAISNAIRDFNETIFFGPITFDPATHLIDLPDPCWQINDTDFFNPVWPKTYPNTVNMICPYKPTYPPPPPVYHNWARFYGLRIGIPLGCVIFIGCIVFIILWVRHKYHLIVISKGGIGDNGGMKDEWGDNAMSSIANGPFGRIANKLCCINDDD